MTTLKFKTNIKCGACVAKVTPLLNGVDGIECWAVDLQSPERFLTVEAASATKDDVQKALANAGYKGEIVAEQVR